MNTVTRCCSATLLLCFPAVLAVTRAADVPAVQCIDAISGASLSCKVEKTSPQTIHGWSRHNPDRLPPPVHVVLTHEGYLTRTIDLSAAFLNRSTTANFAMVKRLPQGQIPTLGTIAQFDRFTKRGEFDRALSVVELLDEHGPSGDPTGTFHVRYMYARHVAYFKACTVLFYITCPLAQAATTELRDDIIGNPSGYARERVSPMGLETYIDNASVATFNEMYARANWFRQRNEYALAAAMYEDARRALSQLSSKVRSQTGMTDKQLKDDIAFMQTLKAASGSKPSAVTPATLGLPPTTPSKPAKQPQPATEKIEATPQT